MRSVNNPRLSTGHCAVSWLKRSASENISLPTGPRLIVLAARGTSDNAATVRPLSAGDHHGHSCISGGPSVVTLYDAHSAYQQDALVVAISQSGESTDTNAVLERAREQGVITVGITNEPESSLARLAEHVFLVRAGKEKSVAATKTYTGQLLTFYLLAYALGATVDLDDCGGCGDGGQHALSSSRASMSSPSATRFMDHAVAVGARPELLECVRVRSEIDGDVLCGGRALFGSRPPARPYRHGGAFVSRIRVYATGVTWPGLRESIEKVQALDADTTVITDASNRARAT